MTDKEQNISEVEQAPTPKDGSTGMNLQGKDRRRFIKRAIIAAPFILTVTSRPVWACNCTLSGQLSGNLSGNQDDDCREGCSPGYWKNHAGNPVKRKSCMWDPVYHPDRLFADVFGVNPFDDNYTLYEVICFCAGGATNIDRMLGFHAVAALQNAANANVDFVYEPQKVIGYTYDAYMGKLNQWDVKDNFDMLNNQGSGLCGYDDHCCDDD